MIPHSPNADLFKLHFSESLKLLAKNTRTIKIAKNKNVYSSGDEDENVYFIERGQIKLLMFSPSGKECLLAIYSAGDVFGELCLAWSGERRETATAINETLLKIIPCSRFLLRLTADSLLEGFIKYLVVRIADQQEVINNLVTADSEQRLGKTLLRLVRRPGKKEPASLRLAYKITHEELSAMVGTTRPRISKFMRKFRDLGLILLDRDRFIVIKEQDLHDYLDQAN